MPYTVPEGSFDELEANVWKQVKNDLPIPSVAIKHHRTRLHIITAALLSAAAAIALLFVLNIRQSDPLTEVDQAFAQLSTSDQNYLLQVYQDDLVLQNN